VPDPGVTENAGNTDAQVQRRPVRQVNVSSLRAIFEQKADGRIYAQSTEPLQRYPPRLTDCLKVWASVAPQRNFLAQRGPNGAWQAITYADAWTRMCRLAAGLLNEGLSPDRPLMILSGNSIEHALLGLAAIYVGIPYAPIAPSYSLAVREYGALGHVLANLDPGLVFVQDGAAFTPALNAVLHDRRVRVVYHTSAPENLNALNLADLEKTGSCSDTDEANCASGPDTIVKILYTSGSTGLPKGVITTNRMLTANQQMLRQVMPCLYEKPPVLCDWLPWNHTFGGSHNFGIVLYNGGTLYIDGGRPTPALFAETARNLHEIAPTAYFNVPKGYEMLVQHLRADVVLRKTFFSRLQLMFFAAAGLNRRTWDELQEIAFETCGEEILVMTGLGSTESAPYAISTSVEGSAPGWIGLPVPGVRVKLAPVGNRMEARLHGPAITPGYWRRPELDEAAFDDENYYRMGDAVAFLDPSHPQKGFVFDGRLNEEFKLSTGTWVHTSMLRTRLLTHFDGLLLDAALAAPNRDYVAALLFPNLDACRKLCPSLGESALAAEIISRPEVRFTFQARLESFVSENPASSTHIRRAILLSSPPSMEASEITDKGTLNQAAVLRNRAMLLDRLYSDPAHADVLTIDGSI
jgi:feruloyl-CoA synthase